MGGQIVARFIPKRPMCAAFQAGYRLTHALKDACNSLSMGFLPIMGGTDDGQLGIGQLQAGCSSAFHQG